MAVKMNPTADSRLYRSSAKLNNNGVKEYKDHERKLTDDVCSLNSWSDRLSTSSSPESGSRRNSPSYYEDQFRDGGLKIKDNFVTAPHAGHSHSAKEHNTTKVESKYKPSPCPAVSAPYKHYGDMHFEVDKSDSEYSLLNSFDIYDPLGASQHQRSKPNAVSSGGNITNIQLPSSNVPAQKLYPDLESLYSNHLQSEAVPSSSFISAKTEVKEDASSSQPQTHRRFFIGIHKVTKDPSRNLNTHSGISHTEASYKPFLSLPDENQLSHHKNVTKHFDKHKTNCSNVQPASQQGVTSLVGRLHKSQPSIASEPQLKRQPKSSSDLESYRLSFEHKLEPENVKTKVKSVWNNIKYGWIFQSRPSVKCENPLYMLGRCYHRSKDDPSTIVEDEFLRDFVSRIWLTYRSNFYPIPGTKLSTDCGWGCMLRTGQMLVAQCLVTHFLGRDWRLYDEQTESQSACYRDILRWFSDPIDTPSDKTPFCLHHLANYGRVYKKDPGEWYGPASVAYIFRDALMKASCTIPVLSQLCVYIAQDCTVYLQDILDMCTETHGSESVSTASVFNDERTGEGGKQDNWQRSVIILIPIRLGGEVMNDIYIPCVQKLLAHSTCMGIIGGKPKHSLYFIGWQDDKLIYLDPHLCREAVDTTVSDFRIETYHCMTPRKLSMSKMDPSCTVGFYIRDRADFKKFVQEVTEFISPPNQKGGYPLFIFADKQLSETPVKQNLEDLDRRVRSAYHRMDQNEQRQRTLSRDSEEFVML